MANVRPDGSWTITRNTMGKTYVQRVLASGRTPGIDTALATDNPVHLRLDCVGHIETSLRLSVDEAVIGTATDPTGLGPGTVGMAGSSRVGVIFDNLVVTAIN